MKHKIKLLLVDDHPVVRDGLRSLQELDSSIEIAATAGTCAEAIEAARQIRPSVVLLDVLLPDGSGIEACRQIRREHPAARILFLSFFAENQLVLNAMNAGASGYLLKNSSASEILAAIHIILKGGTVFDPVARPPEKPAAHPEARLLETLTGQELRVLEAIAAGLTDKEAAARLGLSAKTVRNYLDRVFEKFHVNTRTQAAVIFSRARIS